MGSQSSILIEMFLFYVSFLELFNFYLKKTKKPVQFSMS